MDPDDYPLRPPPVPVRAVPLAVRTTEAPLEVSGRFVSVRAALLKAPTSGFVEGLDLELASPVEKGQVLCTVGATMAQQRKLSSEATVHQLEAQLEEREDALRAARQRGESEERMAGFESKRRAAEHKLAHEKLSLTRYRLLLDAVHVRAPFDARVSELHVAAGATVMSGKPLVSLAATDPITLSLEVPTWVVGKTRVGTRVAIDTPSRPEGIEGVVARWAPTARDDVRRLEVEVPNSDGRVAVGEAAVARLEVGARDAYFAPRAGLRHDKDGSLLQLVEDNQVSLRRVRAYGGDEREVEVSGALSDTQLVVLTAERPLTDRAEVVIRGDH